MDELQRRRVDRRYEKKMGVTAAQHEWVRMLIWQHPANLTEVYPPRYVNNVYLDTFRHSCYVDHVNGLSRRKKVRIRWYGQLEGDLREPQLEIKSRNGWTITKQVHPLHASHLDQLLTPGWLRPAVTHAGCPPALGEMVANLQPTLINRYHRRYFQTRDGQVRVTVDTEMSFHHANRFTNHPRSGYADHAVIVEIKFAEQAVPIGTAVAAHFPLPLNKNSKYVNGIRLLHGE